MMKTKLTKDYFVEDYKIKAETNILYEEDCPYIILKKDGNAMSTDEVEALVKPSMDQLEADGAFTGTTVPEELKGAVKTFIRQEYNRDWKVPDIDRIKKYIITRSPNFAK